MADKIDLTNCDKEPIHIPGRIQSHGFLLVCDENLNINQLSVNTSNFIGIDYKDLLDKPISFLIDSEIIDQIKQYINNNDFTFASQIKLIIENKEFNMLVTSNNNLVILEFEPISDSADNTHSKFYSSVNKIQSTNTLKQLFDTTAEQIKNLIDYDRVMIYRFDKDWHGEVVAEASNDDLEKFYGLHYPHTDIPAQARELYLRNWIRLITDVNEAQPEILPVLNPQTNSSLDLSDSILRATSPIHIEYLKNMGVCATLTISIIFNGKLWGLFACHHYSPKFVDYHMRTTCEFIGKIFSNHLAFKESDEDHKYSNKINENTDQLIKQMSKDWDLIEGLTKDKNTLLDINSSHGAVLFYDGKLITLGDIPSEEDTRHIIEWLNNNVGDLYETDNFSADFQEAINYKDKASGIIYTSLSKLTGDCIIWFKPEERQTVTWGGNPNEKHIVNEDNHIRLSPRKSFEKWVENVNGKSLPWLHSELKAVEKLKENIIKVVMYNSAQLRFLNKELSDRNKDLQSFAHVASHDLKEPLRTITSYSQLVKMKYKDKLDERATEFLDYTIEGAKRMETMINDLLKYAKTGLEKNSFHLQNMNEIVENVLKNMELSIKDKSATIEYNNLPTLVAEKTSMSQLFQNLISNAIKYNDNSPVIKIDCIEKDREWLFSLSDNGIGIEPQYFESIFLMFGRIHSKSDYEGSGIGLSTCKKIVELHNGKIWVESEHGKGSTFFFTISKNL